MYKYKVTYKTASGTICTINVVTERLERIPQLIKSLGKVEITSIKTATGKIVAQRSAG